MGNTNYKYDNIKLSNKINLQLIEVNLNVFENFFDLALKAMQKIEELRLYLAFKWTSLCIKSGVITLENPIFESIIKAIIWRLIGEFIKLKEEDFAFSLKSPYLTVNLSQENKDIKEIVDSYNYFLEFIDERYPSIEHIEQEINSIYFKIVNKRNDKSIFNRLDKEQKKLMYEKIDSNIDSIFKAILVFKQIKELCEEIKKYLSYYIKKYTSKDYINKYNFIPNTVASMKISLTNEYVMQFSKKPKNKDFNLIIQEFNLIGNNFYYNNAFVDKPKELNTKNKKPEKPAVKNSPKKSPAIKQKKKLGTLNNFVENILRSKDNIYIDEYDKKQLKKKLIEIEEEKYKLEQEKEELKIQLEEIEKKKIVTLYSKFIYDKY